MIKQVSIVLAKYCPHCVPLSLSNAKRMAEDLGVSFRVLDIQISEQEKEADRLVEEYGDWSEDYLIPQVFLEYEDGRVDHVLTGFSESVSATEASWEALFSSSYYRNLVLEKDTPEHKPLKSFIEKYFGFKGLCRRHCKKPTTFTEIFSESDCFVGAYACKDGYVSRVIYFSTEPDIEWFRDFLVSQVGEEIVDSRDIRPATRHGWELGDDPSVEMCNMSPSGIVKEIYWTIYPKSEDELNLGVFLCFDPEERQGCRKLFIQDMKLKNKLCNNCNVPS